MKAKEKKLKQGLSVVIITYNVERTFPKLLKTLSEQDYPKSKMEVLIIDGNSTDKTLALARKYKTKLPIKVVQSPYPRDPEACRFVGLQAAKYDIFCYVDADNYFHKKTWLSDGMKAMSAHKDVFGGYAWRYLYDKSDPVDFNRYFALVGFGDPVGYYLGKDDRMGYYTDKWIGLGKIVKDYGDYFLVAYDPKNFPTLGANASFFRKDLIMKHIKISAENVFHTDTALDMARKGYNKYALFRVGIGHNATDSMWKFIKRRGRYMGLHYLSRFDSRRYRVFDPSRKEDLVHLAKFIICSLTFIEPLLLSIRGYIKIRDRAWFIHPIFCFCMCVMYMYSVSKGMVVIKLKNMVKG